MNVKLRKKLISEAKGYYNLDDPVHDFTHIERVLKNADLIFQKEGGDLDVIIPSVLFHDLVTYPKNDPRNKYSLKESAEKAEVILSNIKTFPQFKIGYVTKCIRCVSFTFGTKAESLEEKIVCDSDLLEATGAIAIMRTFAYGGKISRPFYSMVDPLGEKRKLDDLKYSLDVFYTRLLKIEERVYTSTARLIAKKRSKILYSFLRELKDEI